VGLAHRLEPNCQQSKTVLTFAAGLGPMRARHLDGPNDCGHGTAAACADYRRPHGPVSLSLRAWAGRRPPPPFRLLSRPHCPFFDRSSPPLCPQLNAPISVPSHRPSQVSRPKLSPLYPTPIFWPELPANDVGQLSSSCCRHPPQASSTSATI
jgi:hypothetical protein